MENTIHTLIMAGGKGSRMVSKHSKVTHKILGKEMIVRVMELAKKVTTGKVITVVGHKKEDVKECLKDFDVTYVEQKEQLGTGHAVMESSLELEALEGKLIILYGDVPLLTDVTLKKIIKQSNDNKEDLTIASAVLENPTGYGRIVRENGHITEIVEESDADEVQKLIKETNSGIYCIDIKKLLSGIKKLTNDNAQNEYYLTDIVKIFSEEGHNIGTYVIDEIAEVLNVNTRIQLEMVTSYLRRIINLTHMISGVTIEDLNSAYIYENVEIGTDTIIGPNVVIESGAKIGSDCIIGAGSYISSGKSISSGTVIAPNTVV